MAYASESAICLGLCLCILTHNTQHTTHNTQHTTYNTQHTNTQHTTYNTQHTTHNTPSRRRSRCPRPPLCLCCMPAAVNGNGVEFLGGEREADDLCQYAMRLRLWSAESPLGRSCWIALVRLHLHLFFVGGAWVAGGGGVFLQTVGGFLWRISLADFL
jgi:hypothetical protein